MVFEGNPSFNQNIVNKKFMPGTNTWRFIEDTGLEYSVNPLTLEAKRRSIRNIKILN